MKQIFDRARGVGALLEVHRQLRGDLADVIAVDGFAAVTDAAMDLRTPHCREEAVRHLEVQHVAEFVTRSHGAVGQLDQPSRREKLVPGDQRFAALFHPRGRLVEPRADRDRRALHADDGGAFEHAPLVRTQALDLLFDQLPDAVRDPRFDVREAAVQLPLGVAEHDDPFGGEIFSEVDHEERIAFAPAVHQLREPLLQLVSGKPDREVLGHRFRRQVLQRQLTRQRVRLQLPLDGFEGMVAENHLDRSIGADHHQPGGIAASREVGHKIDRGEVAPVQILEHEDERLLGGDRFDGFRHLAQHPLARRAGHLLPQRLAFLGRQE